MKKNRIKTRTIKSIEKQMYDLEMCISFSQNKDNIDDFKELLDKYKREIEIMKVNNIDNYTFI